VSEVLALHDPPRELTLDEELDAVAADERFEMTNLYERHTGLPGVVFVSTRMGSHGPRVKYRLRRGSDEAGFSVSVESEPRILASSLSARELKRAAPAVLAWVALNHQALLGFWNEGRDWSPEEIVEFTALLKKV